MEFYFGTESRKKAIESFRERFFEKNPDEFFSNPSLYKNVPILCGEIKSEHFLYLRDSFFPHIKFWSLEKEIPEEIIFTQKVFLHNEKKSSQEFSPTIKNLWQLKPFIKENPQVFLEEWIKSGLFWSSLREQLKTETSWKRLFLLWTKESLNYKGIKLS